MLFELMLGGVIWLGAERLKRGSGGGDKQKLDRIFRKCGLVVKYNKQEDTPKLIRSSRKENYTEYVYRIPEGLSFKDFEKKREVIEDSLNSNSDNISLSDLKSLSFSKDLKRQIENIKKEKNKRKTVILEWDKVLKVKVYHGKLKDKYDYDKSMSVQCKGWEVPIGMTLEGVIKHNMQKHMIVAGATDYGKTNVTKLMITSLLERRPDDTILSLIDLKGGLAFSRFKDIPQLNGMAKDIESALELLNVIKQQVEDVFQYLEQNGYEDVKEAGITKRHFIFIDEVAELSSANERDKEIKELKVECESIMSFIARLGRAAGFYIIYSTQYPTADVLSTQIKQQCDARLCLRVKNGYASEVVIDEQGAEKLPQIQGRAIYQTSENIVVQVPYVSNDYIERVVKKCGKS